MKPQIDISAQIENNLFVSIPYATVCRANTASGEINKYFKIHQ